MLEKCPCGSGLHYFKCCKPYIKGTYYAPTAEALMRSRYTAYVVKNVDYILDTCLNKENMNIDGIKDWSENSNWLELKINSVKGGGTADIEGIVAFEATYERKGLKNIHREIAKFVKKDNRWFYEDGKIAPVPIVRSQPKVGRNDPCPCRSGKKYKHCCGE